MSQTTGYLNLVKPAASEAYDIEVFNANADAIDAECERLNTSIDADELPDATKSVGKNVKATDNKVEDIKAWIDHNIPRMIPKDITTYYENGSLWDRLEGTNGYEKYEDIYAGDYFQMSRAISAYNQDQTYQETGSDYVTIAGISMLSGNGDNITMNYEHLVMVPGKGKEGKFHFGRSRMNSSHVTTGGYAGSEMHGTTIGAIASSGSTAANATINQQLYAEFGSHLKTTRELLSKTVNTSAANKMGGATAGASSDWAWCDCQAVLMSEVEVYGSVVFSSSGYDTGNANVQLPIFKDKKFVNNRSSYYWLKDVASATHFCHCNVVGDAYSSLAGNAYAYVRPRFVIAA